MSGSTALKIKLGISSCLLGEKVRWNGDGKKDSYLTGVLSQFVEWIPICPEIEVGMGVPRETVNLQGNLDNPRMIGRKSGEDWTARMQSYSRKRIKEQQDTTLHGYIFKKGSPSCGLFRVPVYGRSKMPQKDGRGLFAAAWTENFPVMPVEEEGRLHDSKLRENFIERIFAYQRLLDLWSQGFNRGAVVKFHSAHKYQILAHSNKHYAEMGRLVAKVKEMKPREFKESYSQLFMEALSHKATVRKNTNVLQHIFGYLKKELSAADKKDLLSVIEDYHQQRVPLIVPLTLLRHYVDKFDIQYIQDQTYLNPHPKELMLRNHV